VRDRVEPLVGRARGLARKRNARRPVHPEGAQVLAAVVVGGEVPAPGVHDEAVRAHLAAAGLAREGAVGETDAPPAADGVRELQRDRSADRRSARSGGEAECLLQRLHLDAQGRGQHPHDLGQRAVDRLGLALGGQASRADQPEHDGDRLVVAQHQRGQAVAGPYPVAASHTALALDRDVERLQGRDVAPHRAGVDLQAPRDLPAGRERLGLEHLQQLEQSRGGRQHTLSEAQIEGLIGPLLLLVWRQRRRRREQRCTT